MPDDSEEGNGGYLTADEWDRLLRAVSNAHTHVGWWRVAGHIRLGDLEEHRTRQAEIPLPIPGTWLAAEEISNLLVELNAWPTLEDAANQVPDIAMLLVREVETAMAKWPMSDRPHRVKFFRCMACDQQTLKYFPPRWIGERLIDTAVKCTDKSCRAVMDDLMFSRMAVLIEAEHKERSERAKRLDTDASGTGESGPGPIDGVPVGEGGAGQDDAPWPAALVESA